MTIHCVSSEDLLYDAGTWFAHDLEENREDYLFEAVKAEILSKSQNPYMKYAAVQNTRVLDWHCAYCRTAMQIPFTRSKYHYKVFLCERCENLGYKPIMMKEILDFHNHALTRLSNNMLNEVSKSIFNKGRNHLNRLRRK